MTTGTFHMSRPARTPPAKRTGVAPQPGRIPVALLQAVLATPAQERFALPNLSVPGQLALAVLGLHDRCAIAIAPGILTQAARMPLRAKLDANGLSLTLHAGAAYDPALDAEAAYQWLEALEFAVIDIDASAVPLLTSRLIAWLMAVHASVVPTRLRLHGLQARPLSQARALTLDRWMDLAS
jgi:hypothetical protein